MNMKIKYIICERANVELRNGKAFLQCSEKYDQSKNYRVTRMGCLILAQFDGRRTLGDIISHISELTALTPEKAMKMVEKVADMFSYYIVEAKGRTRDFPSEKTICSSVKTSTYDELKLEPSIFPSTIYYSATNRCGFYCRYCYRDSNSNREETYYLTATRWQELLKEAEGTNCGSFDIGGGEPFFRKDIMDILGVAKKAGLKTKISTKLGLSEEIMRGLRETQLDSLQVSLDSCDKAVCAFLTGQTYSFQMAEKTIDNANRLGQKIHVNCVVNKYNIEGIPKLIEFLEKKKVPTLGLTKYIASCGRNQSDLYATEQQFDQLDEYIYQYRNNNPAIEIDYQYLLGRTFEKMKQTDLTALRVLCGGGKDQLYVRHDGVVGFCDALLYDDHILLGDLSRQSISEVWRSSEVKKWNTPDPEPFKNTICGDCRLFYKCFPYRCYKRSIIAYNTPYALDPFCPRGEKLLCVM